MKKYIGKILIYVLDPIILWCFGWKRKRVIYRISYLTTQPLVLWKDPDKEYGWLETKYAIKVCEDRIRKIS